MPTRVIREGINYSEVINQLSDSAELFYRRLLHVADDYGRYWSDVDSIRAGLNLKEKRTPWTRKKVSRALHECFRFRAVLLYGNGRYICIPKFQQQVRRKSKFPEPPEQFLLIGCTSNAALKDVAADKRRMSLGEGEGEAGCEGGGQRDSWGVEKRGENKPAGQDNSATNARPAQSTVTGPTAELRAGLNGLYKRPPAQSWSYEEECGLIVVSRRADVFSELQLIVNYRRRMSLEDRRFFPALSRLLTEWNVTLDRARATRPPPAQSADSPPVPKPNGPPPGTRPITDAERVELSEQLRQLRQGVKPGDTGK